MKRDAVFNPQIKGQSPPANLQVRLAHAADIDSVCQLMAIRNPTMDAGELRKRTTREIEEWNNGKNYGLFVAQLGDETIGFSRYYHSDNIPSDKKRFPAPAGYYAMGTMVAPAWRRHGVARLLSLKRWQWLMDLKAPCVYSMVALENEASIHMHLNFGYKEVTRAVGFHNIEFAGSQGILFVKDLQTAV